jgi:hypothetical protein
MQLLKQSQLPTPGIVTPNGENSSTLYGSSVVDAGAWHSGAILWAAWTTRRRIGADSIPLGHISIQTTERYLGCKQRIRSTVNDRIGIEPRADP